MVRQPYLQLIDILLSYLIILQSGSMTDAGDKAGTSLQGALNTDTVLILFVEIVILIIYLVSMLLVVVRRARRLLQLHNRKYYFVIVFYITSKLVLCAILIVQVIVGMANNWSNIEPRQVELLVKTALVLADFSIIELFLVALETYLSHCLSAAADGFSRKRSRMLSVGLKGLQIGVGLVLLLPMIIFDVGELGFEVVNAVNIGFNLLIIISFLFTFFYLNFKMTGIMMDNRLNGVIKRIYKVHLIILISRVTAITFEVIIAIYVLPKTFQEQLDEIVAQGLSHEVMLGLVFVGTVLFVLITQGLPVMYSLRSVVVQALNHKSEFLDYKQHMFTDHTSGIEQSLVRREVQEGGTAGIHSNLRLKNFKNLIDVNTDKDDSIWISKKGLFEGRSYLVRISKHQISSYIFQDIENQIVLWGQLNLKSLSKVSYFCEGEIIHLIERFYETRLDDKVELLPSQIQCLKLALQLAQSIRELHHNDIAHGCLSPNHIFIEEGQVVLNGLGLQSFKKYLSLITGYTNKSLYTAVEHLRDKNSVILKPSKAADIYSFGIILFQMVTMNRQYRQLSLRDVQAKFAQQNFRPKLPDHTKHEVKHLIRRCWHEVPERRPAIEQIVEVLKKLT